MRSRGGKDMKHFVLAFVLLIYGIEMLHEVGTRIPSIEEVERTEEFIFRRLQNDNGTIATYILDNEGEDEDLVQGREALAETVGLLKIYALEKKIDFYLIRSMNN